MATWQNREVAVLLAQGLAKCDIVKKDNAILANTIDTQYLMLDVAKDKIDDCFREVEKRDDIIFRAENEFKMSQEINKNLHQTVNSLERKVVWGKIKLGGGIVIGAGLGYLIAKNIK